MCDVVDALLGVYIVVSAHLLGRLHGTRRRRRPVLVVQQRPGGHLLPGLRVPARHFPVDHPRRRRRPLRPRRVVPGAAAASARLRRGRRLPVPLPGSQLPAGKRRRRQLQQLV